MPKAIAYISAVFPLRSETFVYREVRELRRRGRTVLAVSLNDPAESAIPGFADLERDRIIVYGPGMNATLVAAIKESLSHPLGAAAVLAMALRDMIRPGEPMSIRSRWRLLGQAVAGLGLARALRQRGVGHLHCHFAHAPTSVGMYAARRLGIPFSFTGHANDIFQRRALLGRKLTRASLVCCISRWHRDFYRSIVGERAQFKVIRCGVDIEGWKPADQSPDNRLPAAGALRVLAVGRLVEKKGFDTLLAAAEILQKNRTPIELTIAGDGPDLPRLKQIAAAKCGETAVNWLGAVDNERVCELLGECDVFALPCRADAVGDRDGIPVVLMEAMARGRPVIAGNLPAIAELVEPDVTGLLVDGTNAEATAAALSQIANDSTLRQRLAQAGRQRVVEEFSLSANVDRLVEAIDAVAGAPTMAGNVICSAPGTRLI